MKIQESLHFSQCISLISASILEKKLRKLQIRPSATVAVSVGLKSSAKAVELRPSVQHCKSLKFHQ